jgi:uncharacterized delta-60 repeat protein
MCELIVTGLTYDCGPYIITLCDENGNNCVTITITPDPGGLTGVITYPDGTTETYEDGQVDIDVPTSLDGNENIVITVTNNDGEEVVTTSGVGPTIIIPVPSQTPTLTPTVTPTVTATVTQTIGLTPTRTQTKTPTNTSTPTSTNTIPVLAFSSCCTNDVFSFREETQFISTLNPNKSYYVTTTEFTGCVVIIPVRPTNFYEFISISSDYNNCIDCLTATTGNNFCPTPSPTPTSTVTPTRPEKSFKDCCEEIYFGLTEESELIYSLNPSLSYYIITDGYTGCTTIVNYTPPVKYDFVSILEYGDCDTCRTTEFGSICPTPTPTTTTTPTVTPTITPTNTVTPTITPTVTPTFVQRYCYQLSACTSGDIYSGCTTSAFTNNLTYQMSLNISAGTKNTKVQNGSGFNNSVFGVDYQSDGKILVSGNFSQYNGQSLSDEVIRLNSNGQIDNTFNYSGPTYIYINEVLEQPDGKILIGLGQSNSVSGNIIQRVNTDGTLDGGFIPINFPNGGAVSKIKLQPNNKILVAGTFNNAGGTFFHKLVRLDTDGSVDPTFGNGGFLSNLGSESVYNLDLQSDGSIICVGSFTEYDTISANKIVSIEPNGDYNSSFNYGTGFNNSVYAVKVLNDDTILIGGEFTQYSGVSSNRLIKLLSNGNVDTSFVINDGFSDGVVYDIEEDGSGNFIIVGSFTQYQNQTVNGIVKVNSTGGIVSGFSTGTGFNGDVFKISLKKVLSFHSS